MTTSIASSNVSFEELEKDLPRKTVCLLVADLVNSAYFKAETDSATWQATYKLGFRLIADAAARHHGVVVKFLGDGFLFAFADKENGDPEEDCVRAAIAIQKDLEAARQANLTKRFSVRISLVDARAHRVIQTHALASGELAHVTIDYLGPEVDLVFRLNDAISPNGIIANKRLVDNVRWGRIADEFALEAADGDMKRFLGKINLKGLGPTEAHEIAWGGKFLGLKGSQQTVEAAEVRSSPKVSAGAGPSGPGSAPPRAGAPSGPFYEGAEATVQTTRIGHVYSITASQTNFWIQEHSKDAAQHIGVAPNIVRRSVPDMNEVVLFVQRHGVPHPKAVQILRSGTVFSGVVRSAVNGSAKLKVEEYAVNAHGLFDCSYPKELDLHTGDKVEFTLVIDKDPEGRFFAFADDLVKLSNN